MLVVSLRSAVCLLGRFPALAGADLDVEDGEILLVAGANGAGKTTLLRCCAGLLPLRTGTLTVLGHDLARDRRAVRRSVALVGHETFCYDDLTVAENLRFAARAAGRRDVDVAALLERVGLDRQAGVAHGRLSQGQRRRLSLGIALSRDPKLVLLDEPHAGLDTEGRAVVDAVVAAAPAEGRTVLIASHELDLVRTLATREVQIVDGRIFPATAPTTAPRPAPEVEVTP
ncbi:MAG TPA: ABC transporter ATP-binding protein [Acidimicrobiia bacterium]|nr:ABC transporter ATP-binding protein [Acidimicrobiia bacterium]